MVVPDCRLTIKRAFGPIYTLLDNKYYMDKINEVVFAQGAVAIGRGPLEGRRRRRDRRHRQRQCAFVGWFAGVIRFLNPATSTTTRSP